MREKTESFKGTHLVLNGEIIFTSQRDTQFQRNGILNGTNSFTWEMFAANRLFRVA